MSEDSTDTTASSKSVLRRNKIVPSKCKICGDKALYSHCGVIVCPSCKMFFKRNAQNTQKQLKCDFDGNCEVNILNRHVCSFCRLAKCLECGMEAQRLRGEMAKRNKKNGKKHAMITSASLVPINQVQQFPTLNVLQSDQSTLTIDEWKFLSNIVNCYNECNNLVFLEKFVREQDSLPLAKRYQLNAVGDLLNSFIFEAAALYEKNGDFRSLCANDRSVLLRTTIKYVAGYNACFLFNLGHLFESEHFCRSGEMMYGADALKATEWTVNHVDHDTTFVNIIFGIIVFSTFNYTYDIKSSSTNISDIKSLLNIQDAYIDLAWRYLVYKYDELYAIRAFDKFIRCLFQLNVAVVVASEMKM